MSSTDVPKSHAWPQSLLDLLLRQQAMVNELVQLARSQAALIAAGRADQLLSLLAKRQAIIDEFTASQAQLATFTQALDERIETIDIAERTRIKALINEIGDRLTQVMQRDEADQNALRTNRDQVKQELHSLGAARKARTAYQPSTNHTNRYADQHG